jgi:hypothetical protein
MEQESVEDYGHFPILELACTPPRPHQPHSDIMANYLSLSLFSLCLTVEAPAILAIRGAGMRSQLLQQKRKLVFINFFLFFTVNSSFF